MFFIFPKKNARQLALGVLLAGRVFAFQKVARTYFYLFTAQSFVSRLIANNE